MPLVQNKDQTISIQPENANALDLDLAGINVPKNIPAQQAAPQPQQPQGLDLSFEQNWDSQVLDLELPDTLEDHIDSPISNDILGGLATGVMAENFTASMGTVMESWMPDWATGRIVFTDENGDFQSPEYKTISEYVGKTSQEWDEMSVEDRRRTISGYSKEQILKATKADPDSTAFMLSNLAGMLIDPTTAVPILGQSWAARGISGAAIGGIDLAAYEAAQTGSPSLSGVGLGVVLGGTVGMATKLFGRSLGHADSKIKASSQKKIQDFDKVLKNNISITDTPAKALDDTLRMFKMDQDALDILIKDSGHRAQRYMPFQRKTGFVDTLLEPISERMKRISPRLWKHAQEMERKVHEVFHNYSFRVDDFLRKDLHALQKRDKAGFNAIKKAMLNNDIKSFNTLSKQYFKAGYEKNYKAYSEVMKESYALMKAARTGKKAKLGKELDLYLHRAVKDFKPIRTWLKAEERTRIEKIISKKYPTGANDDQLNRIYSDFLAGFYDKAGVKLTPSAAKVRKIKEIPDELLDAFHDPARATHSYLRSAVEDSYRKKFFGSKLVDEFGDDISGDLFGALAQKEVKAGRMSIDDVEELKSLLSLRFIDGVRSPDKAIQTFKDLSYASLLGNPISAITQLGDIFIASAKYGLRDTMSGLAQTVGGRGLSPKEFGLMDALIEEMVSTGATKGVLQKSLRWGGFSSVDKLGKAVNLNAAIKRAQRQIKTSKGMLEMRAKWGQAYGDDFAQLVDDLHSNKITEHTKTLAFAELADVQPITLLEMPEKYLAMTNGRVMYMLRTFQLKFFNMLRQHAYYEFKRGNYVDGIKSATALTSAFTVGGASTDMIKNYVLGRDSYPEDIVVDNLMRTTGVVDKYSADKALRSSDPATKILANMAPPFSVLSPTAATVMDLAVTGELEEKNVSKMIQQVPIVGKIIYNFLLGGAEEYNSKRWKEHT